MKVYDTYNIEDVSQAQLLEWLTPEGQERASGNLETLAIGRPPTKQSPLYKGLDGKEILDAWITTLAEQAVSRPELAALVEYDLSRREKFGPQGGLKPLHKRMRDLLDYWTLPDNSIDPVDVLDYGILDEMIAELFGNKQGLRPLSPENVVKRDKELDKLVTTSGPPLWIPRRNEEAIQNAIWLVTSGNWRFLPCVIGSRSQRGKERFIFIPPFAMNIAEKRFLLPIQDLIRMREIPFFAAYEGFEAVENALQRTNFFTQFKALLVQMDYTAMDKHINDLAIYIYKYVCGSIFQPTHRTEFYETVDHVQTVDVLISLDKVIKGKHGMPSGSGYTNSIETVFSYYLVKVLAKTLDIQSSQGLGDDVLFNVLEQLTPEYVKEVIAETLKFHGYQASADKQRVDATTTIYLQRFFDINIPNQGKVLGMYPSVLALNAAIYPERYHDPRKWSFKLEILRWIMILENCKNLPYFELLVQFFINGDKYRLGLAIPGFFSSLPSLYEESKEIKGFIPTYNQESLDRGIDGFATVQYLKSLAT